MTLEELKILKDDYFKYGLPNGDNANDSFHQAYNDLCNEIERLEANRLEKEDT